MDGRLSWSCRHSRRRASGLDGDCGDPVHRPVAGQQLVGLGVRWRFGGVCGRRITCEWLQDLHVFGRVVRAPTTHAAGATFGDIAPALSLNGDQLAFVRRGSGAQIGQVFVQDLAGARPVGEPRAVTGDQLASNVTWSHDGRSLIYARSNKWSKVRALASCGRWRRAGAHPDECPRIAAVDGSGRQTPRLPADHDRHEHLESAWDQRMTMLGLKGKPGFDQFDVGR